MKKTTLALMSTNDLIKLWHERLGHIDYSNIVKLKDISTGLENINTTPLLNIGSSCIKGKQKKSSFDRRSYHQPMTRLLDFLH